MITRLQFAGFVSFRTQLEVALRQDWPLNHKPFKDLSPDSHSKSLMDSAVCLLLQRGRVAGDPMVIEKTSLKVICYVHTYPSSFGLRSGTTTHRILKCGALEYVG